MMEIESQEVMKLLAAAEAFARAGDPRAALDRAKRARREAKASADVDACDLEIEYLAAAERRAAEAVVTRHAAYVARELAALPDYQAASRAAGILANAH
jgi:hypothetical protein